MDLRIPMQPPTVRPWPWPGWDARGDLLDRYQRRRFRLTLHDLAELRNMHDATRGLNIDWNHLPRQEIAVYVPKNLKHLIRLDSSNSARGTGLNYQDGSWPPIPPTGRTSKGFSLFGGEDWKLPDLKHLRLQPLASPPGAEPPRAHARHWEGAARAWAGGALILLAVVLIVRALENCVHRKFFKTRRRQSEEWPTPNVLATSHRHIHDLDLSSSPRMEDSDVLHSEVNQDTFSNDLPPPYSECANGANTDANKYIGPEEPPPPYSACYVAYSNPKDGVPSVHFLNRRREIIYENRLDAGHSSSMPDINLQNADNTAKESDGCDNSKTELVFENGRVIERDGNNVNSESNTPVDRNECVVDISDAGSSDVPDRSSLQV